MEKIREEFEAWIVSALGCDVADVSKDDGGVYNSYQTGNLYVAWIASRKAICVELPDNINGEYYADGWNACLMCVEGKIKDAGVSCK